MSPHAPPPPLLQTLAAPRRRVAVVVQRYGPQMAGGAEWHAQALVGALAPHHDVTVLSSCALDASTWAMHFEPGPSEVGGVKVLRFAHPQRNEGGRARVPLQHKLRRALYALFDALQRPRVAAANGNPVHDGQQFLQRQGPTCLGLMDELRQGHARYDVVIFFTALYHLTAQGLPVWGARSVLIPTLHDEKPMYLPCFHRVFASAGQTLYNTAAEARLARRLYGPHAADGTVVGAGVHVRQPAAKACAAVQTKYQLPLRYAVYVGRIEKGKGCGELLAAWLSVQSALPDCALVFVGKGNLQLPDTPQVRCTGFVSDPERDALVAGAAVLVVPSRFESLSLVLLEAWALGVPVLVNGRCDVLHEHLQRCPAGESYRGGRALAAGLRRALLRPAEQQRQLGELGRRHVAAHYGWPHITALWLAAIERAAATPAAAAESVGPA